MASGGVNNYTPELKRVANYEDYGQDGGCSPMRNVVEKSISQKLPPFHSLVKGHLDMYPKQDSPMHEKVPEGSKTDARGLDYVNTTGDAEIDLISMIDKWLPEGPETNAGGFEQENTHVAKEADVITSIERHEKCIIDVLLLPGHTPVWTFTTISHRQP